MLQDAIDLQNRAVNELYSLLQNSNSKKNEFTFRAPTGSGKTFMMADLINRIISANKDIVFLISTLSKGNLAEQNYEKFEQYKSSGKFPNLNTYLINTNISGEESLFIPTTYNVYLLPRDLFKKGGRLMQGAMQNFLNTMTFNPFLGGLGKRFILIKDECHIATNNLDSISDEYFEKIINFSATPNLRRGQNPDVQIADEEAVNSCLIKRVVLGDENDTVEAAINKFESIKDNYRNLLGVNPCLIIQISNKDKADYELNNIIFPTLNKIEHQDLKWMLIVDDEKKCNTNDVFKAKKMPVKKWKDYAKENTSGIDIIIFKMVITEGWDIPRACMLYQVRDTKSDQLDEQVIGRVRRNPRLLDFENLNIDAQKLAMTAWIWGILPIRKKKTFAVKPIDEYYDVKSEISIKTTRLKNLSKKANFSIDSFIATKNEDDNFKSIFALYRRLMQSDEHVKNMCYEYSNSIQKWIKFTSHVEEIETEANKFLCDYSKSMTLNESDTGIILSSLPIESYYTDNGNYLLIDDWLWKRKDGQVKFSFDSEAEWDWASRLKDLTSKINSNKQTIVKCRLFGRKNPRYGQPTLLDEPEPKYLNATNKFLWAKNYVSNSEIKYEYYLKGSHFSYPDFIVKDSYDRIHLFEVKSVNISSEVNIDRDSYIAKVAELKKCYKEASRLTGYYFYLPIKKDDSWQISCYFNGLESTLTFDQFVQLISKR